MFKLDLEKAERDQIANIRWIIGKAREFQKSFCLIDYTKAFDCVDPNKLLKILQEIEYQTNLPASWETCMQVKKQQIEPDREQKTGSKLGKEYLKAEYCHLAYLAFYADYIMQNAGVDEAQAGIKIAERNINLKYADDTNLMAESKEASWWKSKRRLKKLA